MSNKRVTIRLKIDATKFVAEMARAQKSLERFAARVGDLPRFITVRRISKHWHRREDPVVSAMHTAYNRRRRARQRRRH